MSTAEFPDDPNLSPLEETAQYALETCFINYAYGLAVSDIARITDSINQVYRGEDDVPALQNMFKYSGQFEQALLNNDLVAAREAAHNAMGWLIREVVYGGHAISINLADSLLQTADAIGMSRKYLRSWVLPTTSLLDYLRPADPTERARLEQLGLAAQAKLRLTSREAKKFDHTEQRQRKRRARRKH